MPTISGLPQLSNINFNDSLQLTKESFHYAVEYLEIPPLYAVSGALKVATGDMVAASKSSFALVYLTTRPLAILTSLVSRYIWILLKIIAQHTVYHGLIAAKEALRQAKIATNWFIAFQKSLSTTALCLEGGFVVLCFGLYMLRRYIQKKKYAQRVKTWYTNKKAKAVMKYERFVEKVAKTSMLLALLLPHIIYVVGVSLIKYFMPQVVGYFSNQTILADVLGLYWPFVKSIHVIHKWRSFGLMEKVNDAASIVDDKNNNGKGSGSESKKDGIDQANAATSTRSIMNMFRRKKVSENYEAALREKSRSSSTKNNSKTSTDKRKVAVAQIRLNDEQRQVGEEISELLQYWVVFALLLGMSKICMLLPLFGRFLSNMSLNKSASSLKTPWGRRKISWLEKIKPSVEFFNECKLFFFVWVQVLPTSIVGSASTKRTASAINTKSDIKSRIVAFEKGDTKNGKTSVPFANRPIDILFQKLSPAVIALNSSTSRILDQIETDNPDNSKKQSFVVRCLTWCRTFLDVMVWTKLISEKTKRTIISTLSECSDLLVCLPTFFMPSYFTSYGIVYIHLIVPSANSVNCRNAYQKRPKSTTNTELVKMINRALRYLQYWVIQCILSWIISSFSPILSWIPFSTHIIFLVWAYFQLESVSNLIYDVFESELVAFGILKIHAHKDNSDNQSSPDLNNTITMKLLKNLAKRVPSATSEDNQISSKSEKKDVDAKSQSGSDCDASKDANKTSEDQNEKKDIHVDSSGDSKKISSKESNGTEEKMPVEEEEEGYTDNALLDAIPGDTDCSTSNANDGDFIHVGDSKDEVKTS